MTWVNFAEIRARVSLDDVLFQLYALPNLTRQGDKVIGPCPIHNGDGGRAFQADLTKKVWHCFACKRGGNQIDFVAAKEGCSIRDAGLLLQRRFLASGDGGEAGGPGADHGVVATAGVVTTAPRSVTPTTAAPPTEPGPVPVLRRNPPLDLRLSLKPDHPHLIDERKLSTETLRAFGVGYCATGTLRGQIAIPVHDEDGVLVAYAGRRLKSEDIAAQGKYRFPKGFVRDVVVYNYHRAAAAMGERGLVVVEGFFTVMKLHEAGFPHTVATMGVEVSALQLELLARAPRVFVVFDGDDAGRRGGADLAAKLKDRTAVHLIEIPQGTEPEDLSPKALRWTLNGARELGLAVLSFSTTT